MEVIADIAAIHHLTPTQTLRLKDYLLYLCSVPGNADVAQFIEKLKTGPKSEVLKYLKSDNMVFILSDHRKNMNTHREPTPSEVADAVRLFFETLTAHKGKLSRDMVSFYFNNYTGYSLNSPKLQHLNAEQIKLRRFRGCFDILKMLPADGFWGLYELFKESKLPSVEDMY